MARKNRNGTWILSGFIARSVFLRIVRNIFLINRMSGTKYQLQTWILENTSATPKFDALFITLSRFVPLIGFIFESNCFTIGLFYGSGLTQPREILAA